MKDTVKCRWSHCKHDSKELKREDAVLSGKNAYYHADCFKEKETIQKILTTYQERVDAFPVWAQLRSIVNKIVFKQECDPEYLLFAMNYVLDNGGKLNTPMGLYYIIKDYKAKEAWERKRKQKQQQIDFVVEEDIKPTGEFNYSTRVSGFGKILGR